MTAYVFPGQGAQFVGMGKDLYDSSALARKLFEKANTILGFRITDLMFEGTDDDLRHTDVTQPAVFLHSVVAELVAEEQGAARPDMVAGHSLGEYSALAVSGAVRFDDALRLVAIRANAMQRACELHPGTMAAVLRQDDEAVDAACKAVSAQSGEVVVAANYNCPGQVVISGSLSGIEQASAYMKEQGMKRIIPLNVGGAFHSPLMQVAADELTQGILNTPFYTPRCPIYQNVDGKPQYSPEQIKANLVAQLTSPVRWTQTVMNMLSDNACSFTEFGPGEVLTGLINKIRQ